MTGMKEMLLKEKRRLENIIRKTEKQMQYAPEGSLRISSSHSCPQFYHKFEGANKNGNYISKSEADLVTSLAQKSYDQKVLKLAKTRLAQIEELEKDYQDDEIEQLFLNEHPLRQSMIHPVEPTWEQMLAEWKLKAYEGQRFTDMDPYIVTEKGLRVRSKSEKMMAEYLDRHGIPYKYEQPKYLKGAGYRYPDFTYFSKEKGCEVYHEHLGKMDDSDYVNRNLQKIRDYQKNGIYLGDRLFLTFETAKQVLDMRDFEEKLKKYVL